MESTKRMYASFLLPISLASDMDRVKSAKSVKPCEFEEGRGKGRVVQLWLTGVDQMEI